MRLPRNGSEIDMTELKQMVDLYMENGFTYFDTAFGYVEGRSEDATREAVVERYPRESFQLATKFPVWLANKKEDLQRIFDTQMQRTGAGYFDFYLLHAIGASRLETLDGLDLWGFMRELKEKGLVKHIGFSFHDSAAVLDQMLTAHPEIEFVQLQINYVDWNDENVQSRLCYEVCMKHGKPVIVMEPVKGGMLAGMSDAARNELLQVRPESSVASWAVRYCASLDGIVTVLSGMSNLEQVKDNVASMRNFEPLNAEEYATIDRVIDILKSTPTIPCTSCEYCTEKCPQNIGIPRIFGVYNNSLIYGMSDGLKGSYGFATNGRGKASTCIECGVCESRCPQHIEIMNLLKTAAEIFE